MQFEEILATAWDVAIVGGGPGGMGAALYASRADLRTLVIEKAYVGGLIALTMDVENYPAVDYASGLELSSRMEQQVRKFGAEVLFKEVVKVDKTGTAFSITLADGNTLTSRTVVIAC